MTRMKNSGSITNGSFMIVDMTKQANDAAQNVLVCLTNAVKDASAGIDYSENWEKAMQYQTELLRLINDIKYRQSSKPRSINVQQASGIV